MEASLRVTSAVPRMLVVTDADISAASRGAGRTLLNLLSGWPADAARVITTARNQPASDAHGHRISDAGWRLPGGLNERLRAVVGDLHAQAMAWHPLDHSALRAFNPEVLLIVPTTAASLVLGTRWAATLRRPSATWLMDDWVQQFDERWPTGSARDTARQLLTRNSGWLVISEYLAEEIRRWVGVERPTAVVHNAVEIGEPPAALSTPRSGTFTLRYAGSLWPMHIDALALVARAVAGMRAAGRDIRLVIHTDTRMWGWHDALWRETGTEYGGLLPYESLRDTLADSDLLVVTSSFDPAQARMTRSSVQTKITDYLATGRAILNVGPPDGACTRFLRAREIAVHIEVPDVAAATHTLEQAMGARPALLEMARRGWDICARDHEIGAVNAKVAAFLSGLPVTP